MVFFIDKYFICILGIIIWGICIKDIYFFVWGEIEVCFNRFYEIII